MSDASPAAPIGDDTALAIRGLVKIYGNLIAGPTARGRR